MKLRDYVNGTYVFSEGVDLDIYTDCEQQDFKETIKNYKEHFDMDAEVYEIDKFSKIGQGENELDGAIQAYLNSMPSDLHNVGIVENQGHRFKYYAPKFKCFNGSWFVHGQNRKSVTQEHNIVDYQVNNYLSIETFKKGQQNGLVQHQYYDENYDEVIFRQEIDGKTLYDITFNHNYDIIFSDHDSFEVQRNRDKTLWETNHVNRREDIIIYQEEVKIVERVRDTNKPWIEFCTDKQSGEVRVTQS